jgi:CcmD family protein
MLRITRNTPATVIVLMAAAWLLAAASSRAAAQAAAPESQPVAAGQPAQSAHDQYVPVRGLPPQERLPAPVLVMTAYGFVWAVLLVYVWTVWRRLMHVEREIQDLAARIARRV